MTAQLSLSIAIAAVALAPSWTIALQARIIFSGCGCWKTFLQVIPLTAEAMDAILELRERAKGFFGNNRSPDWYVSTGREGQPRALISP